MTLSAMVDMSDYDSRAASEIRIASRDHQYARRTPAAFVARYTQATRDGFETWRRAREANDFSLFAPALQRVLDLQLEEAEIRGYDDDPFDVFIQRWERDFTTEQVQQIFDAHRPRFD